MTENTDEKNFTYQIELVNISFSPQRGGNLKLDGKTRSGKPFYGMLFDGAAHALNKKLGSIIPPGENVSSMNLVADITGRWIERAVTKDADCKDKKGSRYFRIHEFDVLNGPRLEVARIGREAARALETSQKVVDLEAAYHVLAEFAARIGGVTFDPRASSYLSKSNDDTLKDDQAPVSDPEEDAVRRYEDQDRVSGLTSAIMDAPEIEAAPAVDPEPEVPAIEETALEETAILDADDEVVLEGSIEGVENAPEMEAFTLEDESPLSAEPVVTEDEEPEFGNEVDAEDSHEVTEDDEAEASLAQEVVEEVKAEEPVAPARPAPSVIPARPSAPARPAPSVIPARPSAPARPAPPSRVPPRPVAQAAPGPRR
ncbi:hypothetical protein [Rhizobium sp. MHM7A]|uniref:hypothetical protein n=1 Tax=Rhizobium sp. MHM7A TaxID=2583233 RepID=UPI0011073DA8|nr:hypothetical protein [Rhizobium sp. MHM7A]TLX17041.1 hypothetical protein FFR93_06920 [Rhizobium sp. MHM7A]